MRVGASASIVPMAEIAVTVQASGEAYVTLVVGTAPEVRDSVALDALEAADAIPALDGLVLDFDHYGRVVGLRITGAVDSILAPSLLEGAVPGPGVSVIEFPADDPERARRFWTGFLAVEMEAREAAEGDGWQTHSGAPAVGVHARGPGPGDSFSLPYFAVSDIAEALERVEALGGSVVHPGETWAICKDSEGSPFGLARQGVGG
jgi:predicted enzyme related to lactoylglutathione lyase